MGNGCDQHPSSLSGKYRERPLLETGLFRQHGGVLSASLVSHQTWWCLVSHQNKAVGGVNLVLMVCTGSYSLHQQPLHPLLLRLVPEKFLAHVQGDPLWSRKLIERVLFWSVLICPLHHRIHPGYGGASFWCNCNRGRRTVQGSQSRKTFVIP